MSGELASLLILIAIFLIGTTMGINMGVLGFVAAFAVGTALAVPEDDIFAAFPGDLFVILVGVTFLFAIASNNGTVDWLIHAMVRAVKGRVVALPWVFFLATAILTASGAVVPGAVAIVAPIGIGFAVRFGISPVLMGLMIVNGATAGGFSPISVFGGIVNEAVSDVNLPQNELLLFVASFVANSILSVIVFFLFGGRKLFGRRVDPDDAVADDGESAEEARRVPVGERTSGAVAQRGTVQTGGATSSASKTPELNFDKIATLAGILILIVVALLFDVDVGFVALSIAAALSLISPKVSKDAVGKVAWPTVLLITGLVTYVTLLQDIGYVDELGQQIADIPAPLLAALLILFTGAIVSAFASTTGILGTLIPFALPFLETGAVGAVGLIVALSLSSSIVDSSPFSTSGALALASTPENRRDYMYKRLLQWGATMILVIPPITWLIFIVI